MMLSWDTGWRRPLSDPRSAKFCYKLRKCRGWGSIPRPAQHSKENAPNEGRRVAAFTLYFYSCATALRSRKGLPRPLWRYYHSSIWTKRREVIGNCGYRFTDSLTFIARKIRGRRVIWNKRPRLNWYHVPCSYGVTFKFQLGAILKWRIHWGGVNEMQT